MPVKRSLACRRLAHGHSLPRLALSGAVRSRKETESELMASWGMALGHVREFPIAIDQLLERPALDDASLIAGNDDVGFHRARQPMRDKE